MKFEKKTTLEKVTGSLPVTIATSAIGAFAGGIPGAILPILTNSLAHQRHIARIEKAINDILIVLDKHQYELENIKDSQYKIISESISCIYSTVDDGKVELLKKAVKNTLSYQDLSNEESEKISRIIRDISVSEAKFLVERSLNEKPYDHITILKNAPLQKPQKMQSGSNTVSLSITLVSPDDYVKNNSLCIRDKSKTCQMITDLQNLGVIMSTGSHEDGEAYSFTPISAKVSNILK